MLENDLEQDLHDDTEEYWIAVSDLMSGLMMVFMLISVTYLVILDRKNKEVQQEVIPYADLRDALYTDLEQEFSRDMQRWGPELSRDLEFRFTNTDLLFEEGESELKVDFVEILQDLN